jgi:antitoxin FitA
LPVRCLGDADRWLAVSDSNDYNAGDAGDRTMATLTIRNLEDALKSRLRLRAAARNRSMEDEVRHILRAALQEPAVPVSDMGTRIRARFAGLGDVNLPIAEREPVRPPPSFEPAPAKAARRK